MNFIGYHKVATIQYAAQPSEHLPFAASGSLEIAIDLLRERIGQDIIVHISRAAVLRIRLILHEASLNAVQHLLAGIPAIPEIEECLVVVPIPEIYR